MRVYIYIYVYVYEYMYICYVVITCQYVTLINLSLHGLLFQPSQQVFYLNFLSNRYNNFLINFHQIFWSDPSFT